MDQTWARWALWCVAVIVFVLVLLARRALMARVVDRWTRPDQPVPLAAMTDEEVRSVLDDIDGVAMRRVDEADVMLAGLRSRVGGDRVRAVDARRRSDQGRLAAWSLEDHTAQGLPLHVEIDRVGPSVPESLRTSMLEALRAGRVQHDETSGAHRVVLSEIHVAGAPWWVVTAEFGHGEVEHVAYPAATDAVIRYDRLVRRLRGAKPDR